MRLGKGSHLARFDHETRHVECVTLLRLVLTVRVRLLRHGNNWLGTEATCMRTIRRHSHLLDAAMHD